MISEVELKFVFTLGEFTEVSNFRNNYIIIGNNMLKLLEEVKDNC